MTLFNPTKKNLLLTDVDDSFYSEKVPVSTLRQLHEYCANQFDIVYLSGRTGPDLLHLIENNMIPYPKCAFSDFGLNILIDGDFIPNPLVEAAITVQDRLRIEDIAGRCSFLRPQVISDNRLSYIILDTEVDLSKIAADMSGSSVAIHLSQRYLDALPKSIHKGIAADLLINNMRAFYERILLVGDSDNDYHLDLTHPEVGIFGIRLKGNRSTYFSNQRVGVNVVKDIRELKKAITKCFR